MRIKTLKMLQLSLIWLPVCSMKLFAADTLAIEVGDRNINLVYQPTIETGYNYPLVLDTSLLYTKQKGHQDLLGGIGLRMMGPGSQQALNFAIGIKGFITDVLDYRVGAITPGGSIHYRVKAQPEISLQCSLYYAAEAMTTMDGDYFRLVEINADYILSPNTSLRLGYRDINAGIKNETDAELDQGAYLGWVIRF